MALKIAVCIKSVPNPDCYDQIEIDPTHKTLIRAGIPAVISSADKHALELALILDDRHGADITVVSMGPPEAQAQLYEALALGADRAVLLSDRLLAGADTLATAYTLSVLLQHLGGFDLVLAGNESDDGATAHVPSQLGEWLGIPHAADIVGVELQPDAAVIIRQAVTGGIRVCKLRTPCLLAVKKKINQVRHINMMELFAAKSKPLIVMSAGDLPGLLSEYTGLAGSPTQGGTLRGLAHGRNATTLEGNPQEIAETILGKINTLISIK